MKFNLIVVALSLSLAGLAFAQYQPHAIWQREGEGDSSLYGEAILALGDQNGDGYNDWAVYQAGLGYAPEGSPNEPKVEFFHGGNPPETEPYMVRVKDPATEVAVRGAAALGDLNGDGYVDWYVFTNNLGDTTERRIFKIYFGGPGPHEVPDLVLTAPWFTNYWGIGDFNDDGYDDLLLCDTWGDSTCIYFGGTPLDTIPDWKLSYALLPRVDDLNGDRVSDLVCRGNHFTGTEVFLGSSRPDTVPSYSWPDISYGIIDDVNRDGFDDLCAVVSGRASLSWGGTPPHTTEDAHMEFPCQNLPRLILSAGDFNGDGFGDIVMLINYCYDYYWGILTVHLGGHWVNPQPAFVIHGWTEPFNLIHFKTAVNLGDVNGDHVDDLAIGANQDGPEYAAWRGKAVILSGDTSLRVDAEEPRVELPRRLEVSAYPNPFNGSTTVEVSVPVYAQEVSLTVYNLLGQQVISTQLKVAGAVITYHLDASGLSTGLYLLRVSSGNLQATTKLMLMK